MKRPDAALFAAARQRFETLADLEAGERAAALRELAEREPELAAAVAELLAADESAGDEFLAGGAAVLDPSLVGEALAGAESAGVEPGDRLGPYRLQTLLGQGGMGEVWEAERADGQFEQTVALKLLKRGMDSAAVLRRFLLERQILARLEHPNIARLLDGGIAPDGRPYLVLERVQGEPIHDWCRNRGSSIGERLRLMIAACEAVDAAHRNLVVHRDLKPSNILVDNDGRVKLLDFGIAKLLVSEGEGDPDAERTRLEERALTPAYAAPEQILGQPVTTATDVYALGVVLYELLSGKLPHRRNPSSVVALADEVQRETLVRPSRMAASNGDMRLARLLTGDLDTILLKALAREPERRYGGAAALADDLARHLDGRPVAARPDRVGYRVAKFVGRHRLAVGVSSLALLALLVATGVSIRQAKIAGLEAAKANAIQKFVFGLFEVNRVRNPDGAKARETTAQELLQLAAGELGKTAPEGGVAGEVRAELLDTVADLHADLGLHEEAVRLWSALADEREGRTADAALAGVLVNRGISANLIGRGEEARADFERALAILDGVGDRQSTLRGWTLYNLGHHFWSAPGSDKGRAEELFREAIAVLAPHGPTRELANAHYGLGRLLESRPDPEGAKLSFRAGITAAEGAQGIARTVVAGGYQQLSRVQAATQDFAGAEASIRRAMAVFEEFAGKDHRLTIEAGNDLGRVFDATDRPAEALPLLERALGDRLARLGPVHANSISTRFSLAQARLNAGDVANGLAAARELARDIAADARLQEDRGGIVTWLHARALLLAGRLDEAAVELARARPLLLARLGEQSPWIADADLLESEIALARGAPHEAQSMLTAVEARLTGPAASAQRLARHAVLKSAASLDLGEPAAARVSAERALEIAAGMPGREYRRLAEAAAWHAAGRAAARLDDRPAAAAAAGKARELYRAALLPASSGLRDRELELDRLSR